MDSAAWTLIFLVPAKYVATNTVRLVNLIMCFIILFAVVAAVCVITAIVTVLRKKQSEAIEVERENNTKLETINKTIPIIAMTANAFSEDIQYSFAAGMNVHISKPVEMKVLEKTIRSIKFVGVSNRRSLNSDK